MHSPCSDVLLKLLHVFNSEENAQVSWDLIVDFVTLYFLNLLTGFIPAVILIRFLKWLLNFFFFPFCKY